MDNTFSIIAVTPVEIVPDEARIVSLMLDSGISRVHLRHPGVTADRLAGIIEQVPSWLHDRISIHDHHGLVNRFPDIWLHLNRRNPSALPGVPYSRSCHSFEEINNDRDARYVFLSPVFDSVSKPGYNSAFAAGDLEGASARGLIDSHVYALGGVVPEHLPLLRRIGFGGAAMLGYLWADLDIDNIKSRIDAAIYHTLH